MNSFFQRILLSVWLTLFLAVLGTYFIGRLLPFSDESPEADVALVAAIARDLRDAIAAGESAPASAVADRFSLSFENRLQVYVIERVSRSDIQGRELPAAVQLLLAQGDGGELPFGYRDERIVQHDVPLPGYLVVGFLEGLPRFFFGPQERYLLLLVIVLVSAAM
ncbi:MAG: hypothetical protein AAGA23_12360 [Pseudomonadota bacterium]